MKLNIGETVTAAAVMAFGAAMAFFGSRYPVGTVSQMGPGYFPAMLGGATVLIGGATLISVRKSDAPAPDVPWVPAGLVLLGLLGWALTAERFGLVPASFIVVALSALARPPVRIVSTLLIASIASAAALLIFVKGFGLPLHAFRW